MVFRGTETSPAQDQGCYTGTPCLQFCDLHPHLESPEAQGLLALLPYGVSKGLPCSKSSVPPVSLSEVAYCRSPTGSFDKSHEPAAFFRHRTHKHTGLCLLPSSPSRHPLGVVLATWSKTELQVPSEHPPPRQQYRQSEEREHVLLREAAHAPHNNRGQRSSEEARGKSSFIQMVACPGLSGILLLKKEMNGEMDIGRQLVGLP